MFKKYLLASAAMFAPPGEGGEGEDQHVEESVSNEEEVENAGQDPGEQEGEDEGDETPDAEGDDEGSVDDVPAPRKPSRAQSRIQALTKTASEAKEKAERLDREIQEIRAEQRQRAQAAQQESPTEKAARRALMSDVEIMREDMQESEKRTAAVLHQHAVQAQETNDKLSYNSLLRDRPHLKKYDAEVERVRQEQQARGVFVPREVLLKLAVGDAAMKAAERTGPKAQKQGQQRIAAQQSKPASARGDTATARGKQGDSLEKRLENMPI